MAQVRPTLMASIPLFFERIAHRVTTELARGPGYRRAVFGWATGLGDRHYENHLAGREDGPWHRFQRWVAVRTVLRPLRRSLGGRLRYLLSGGAALPEATGRFFESIGIPILEGYGLTETAPILTANRPGTYRYGTVGEVVAGTEIRIDPDSGEILARGPQIMQGYRNRPQETAEALRDGWLHTGDLGELDADGYLYVRGRKKDMVIVGGYNVYPREVEEVLCRHPAVAEAAVVGGPDPYWGECLHAYVALRQRVDEAALLEHCRAHLAKYKIPATLEILDALPRTSVNKLDKLVLKERWTRS
jgi:long-chain acyl-CoA synthetase